MNENKINEDTQVTKVAEYLNGKNIALCVTGGIAAIETPKIARQLRRYGANVKAYTTLEAEKFIGLTSLEWGTGKAVVSKLSGASEHICREDLVLVAPATTNTINKIFCGIADNSVTTLVASALGQNKPVLIALTMHESLYNNPILQKNLAQAESYGIGIINPRISEGKAKIAQLDEIVANVSKTLSTDKLRGMKILITAGPTPTYIDDIRIITNTFKGTLGIKIAKELYHRGADVKLLLGGYATVPKYLDTIRHKNFDEYYENTITELDKGYNIGIFSAAVADYRPEKKFNGKIGSLKKLNIDFMQTPKIIDIVRDKYPELYMATFKFTIGRTYDELIDIAKLRAEKYQLVVANRGEDMQAAHNAYIVNKTGVIASPSGKDNIAKELVDIIGKEYLQK